jgi:GxxExxY protein
VDFVVEEELVLELKAVDRVLPIHEAQVMTYLRLLGLRQGFLFNFNVRRMVDGVTSILNSQAPTPALAPSANHEEVEE